MTATWEASPPSTRSVRAWLTSLGLGGTFKAWMSDDSTAARDRLTHSTGRYVRSDNQVIADDWSDLVDGLLDIEINRTENNGAAPNTTASCGTTNSVWTGSYASGGSAASSCGNWNTADVSGLNGLFGNANSTDEWSFTCTTTGCAADRSVYCVEQ